MTDTTHANGLQIIHISSAGPEYWISVGDKIMRFEDHRYCGPIVVGNKTGDPLDNQPGERDKFWLHYDAWAKQGDLRLDEALPVLRDALYTLLGTDDAREGLTAFMEKRAPRWTGR